MFNVYTEMANSDADVIIHLGDYIYENGNGLQDVRQVQPPHDIVTKDDYRTRYHHYRQDPQLQLAHAKKAWIVIWDDRELGNNAFADGADGHDPEDGNFDKRQRIAYGVWSEYIGTRRFDDGADLREIYRSFEFGNIVNLVMTETRGLKRDVQMSDTFMDLDTGALNNSAYWPHLFDENREMMGTKQRSWVKQTLQGSKSIWTVLASSVILGKSGRPLEFQYGFLRTYAALFSGRGDLEKEGGYFFSILSDLVKIKQRLDAKDPTLTPTELSRLQPIYYIPQYMDQWDGYFAEREKLFDLLATKANVVSIAGDSHNAWYNHLVNKAGKLIGHEFATPSVTAQGLDQVYPRLTPDLVTVIEAAFTTLTEITQYFSVRHRGYIMLKFDRQNATAQYLYIDNIISTNYSVIQGPTFEVFVSV
jgi:alkaline phosphatase D